MCALELNYVALLILYCRENFIRVHSVAAHSTGFVSIYVYVMQLASQLTELQKIIPKQLAQIKSTKSAVSNYIWVQCVLFYDRVASELCLTSYLANSLCICVSVCVCMCVCLRLCVCMCHVRNLLQLEKRVAKAPSAIDLAMMSASNMPPLAATKEVVESASSKRSGEYKCTICDHISVVIASLTLFSARLFNLFS